MIYPSLAFSRKLQDFCFLDMGSVVVFKLKEAEKQRGLMSCSRRNFLIPLSHTKCAKMFLSVHVLWRTSGKKGGNQRLRKTQKLLPSGGSACCCKIITSSRAVPLSVQRMHQSRRDSNSHQRDGGEDVQGQERSGWQDR